MSWWLATIKTHPKSATSYSTSCVDGVVVNVFSGGKQSNKLILINDLEQK